MLALDPFLLSSGLALMGAVLDESFFPGTGLAMGDRTLDTIILRPEPLDGEGEPRLVVAGETSVVMPSSGAAGVVVFLLVATVELERAFLLVETGLGLGDVLWMITTEDLTDDDDGVLVVLDPMTGLPLGDAALPLALKGLDLPPEEPMVRGLFRGEMGLFRGEIGLDLGELALLVLVVALFLGETGLLPLRGVLFTPLLLLVMVVVV